jgi:carotenoid cleavage dioxygenase-like enzyme
MRIQIKKRQIKRRQIKMGQEDILQKINGFYGLIGPNIERKETKSIYDLFMGNGMVQGVFIKDGSITYIKQEIETDKFKMEDHYLRKRNRKPIPMIPIPNMLGVANTAFFHFKNKTYALFERDLPYIIDIDFDKKKMNTLGKCEIEDIAHFSAHPKIRYSDDYSYIETIDYDILQKKVKVYQLDPYFRILSTMQIPMKYASMVHDFISTPNSIILLNSPFMADIHLLPHFSAKLKLDVTRSSIFYVVGRENNRVERYYIDQGIYIFHYTDVYETEKEITIYAPVHLSLDFSKLEIKGKYRKLVLNKQTRTVKIEQNPELEKWNVEFPVPFFHENKKKIMMRYVDESNWLNTGFIICHQLEIEKRICFQGRCICGEPSIISISDTEDPYALFFTIDVNDNGYFNILNLVTEEMVEIIINEKMKLGFHSLFLPNLNT